MGAVATAVFVRAAGEGGATLSFGRPPAAGELSPALETLRQGATNTAFAAVAWSTAVLSAISAVIAWVTLEHKGGKAPAKAAVER